jgi:hypothetical protein
VFAGHTAKQFAAIHIFINFPPLPSIFDNGPNRGEPAWTANPPHGGKLVGKRGPTIDPEDIGPELIASLHHRHLQIIRN